MNSARNDRKALLKVLLVLGIAMLFAFLLWQRTPRGPTLRVALAPYQDMALLTLNDDYGLAEKYGLQLELVTVTWEDLLPSIASAGPTADVAFAGLHEYLTKYQALNRGSTDPIVYLFPAYVFKGAAFVSFNDAVPDLRGREALTPDDVRKFLSYKIAVQRYSTSHMMLASLAEKHGLDPKDITFIDVPLDDGLLAAQAGSVDMAATGLTQRSEALKRGARVVLDMDVTGFADVTGFVARQSTLRARRADIEKLIRGWFDCTGRFWSNPTKEAPAVLEYLDKKAATNYSTEGLLEALSHEYFPRSLEEANRELVDDRGSFPVKRISELFSRFLVEAGLSESEPPPPEPLQISG